MGNTRRSIRLAFFLPLLACLCAAPTHAREPSAFERMYERSMRVPTGEWSGHVSGELNTSLQGEARFRMFDADGPKKDFSVNLRDPGHNYLIHVDGVLDCRRRSAVYPTELDMDAATPLRPDGVVGITFNANPAYDVKSYLPKSGQMSVDWQDDSFTIHISAELQGIALPPHPRILIQASAVLERGPDSEHFFDDEQCAERFEVVEVQPSAGHRSVIAGDAEILVRFNHPVDPRSLDGRSPVLVQTRRSHLRAGEWESERTPAPVPDVSNAPLHLLPEEEVITVPGQVELKDARTLRFVPSEPLLEGVHYEIWVQGDEEGVRSSDGAGLDPDLFEPQRFTTLIEPDDVRVEVYQTSRDAPLLLRKATMVRLFVDWAINEDVHPDWRLESYVAEAEVLEDGDRVAFPRQRAEVRTPESYDDEDRRLARDSVNRFGWFPATDRTRELVALLHPEQPAYPEDRGWEPREWTVPISFVRNQVDEYSAALHIVNVAEWRDDPPDGALLRHIHQAFRSESAFQAQIFPVLRVRNLHAANFTPPSCGIWCLSEVAREDYLGYSHQLAMMHDHLFATNPQWADVTIAILPASLGAGGKAAPTSKHWDRLYQVLAITVAESEGTPAITRFPLITHEVGHLFDLPHEPDPVDEEARERECRAGYTTSDAGIEGFRLLADGSGGWSKSSTTGNQQDENLLKYLMYPCVHDPRESFWITEARYEWLADRLSMMLRAGRGQLRLGSVTPAMTPAPELPWDPVIDIGQDPVQMASNAVPGDPRRWVLVSGFSDGERAELLPVVALAGPQRPTAPDGTYTAVVKGRDGQVLGEHPTGPVVTANAEGVPEQWYFSAPVGIASEIGSVELRKGGRVIAQLQAGPRAQAPRWLWPAPGDRVSAGDTLRWESTGEAAGGARYSLRYRPDGDAPWQTIAALQEVTELKVPPATLTFGASPMLRVIEHAGVDERSSDIQITLDDSLRPLLVYPEGSMAEGDLPQIGAWFNTMLRSDVPLDNAMLLFDADDEVVPARVRVAATGDSLELAPEAPLQPGQRYRVELAGGVRAEDGRRSSGQEWEFQTPGSLQSAAEAPGSAVANPDPSGMQAAPPAPAPATAAGLAAPNTAMLRIIADRPLELPLTLSACRPDGHPDGTLVQGLGGLPDGSPMHVALSQSGPQAYEMRLTHDAEGRQLIGRVAFGEDAPPPRWSPPRWLVAGTLRIGTEPSQFMLLATCAE